MSNILTCPLDNQPCERDCPDRYTDRPEGGCILTTALEQGYTLIDLGGNDVGILIRPDSGR